MRLRTNEICPVHHSCLVADESSMSNRDCYVSEFRGLKIHIPERLSRIALTRRNAKTVEWQDRRTAQEVRDLP
jgi:hypothetical protein